ncbi:MAG: ECF transporter S component [Candidatus Zixiibacteriota bacterium]
MTALFIALGVVLPVGFHSLSILGGRMFLPMHIPVLIAGLFLGPSTGLLVGLVCPVLSFLLTGMPPPDKIITMTLELPLYGLAGGIAYRSLKVPLVVSLLIALTVGRLAYAFGLVIIGQFLALPFTPLQFLQYSTIVGIWGIILQFVIIPPVVKGLEKVRGVTS